MTAENSDLHLHKYKKKQLKTVFLNCNNVSQYYCLVYFWPKKCSLGEHKRFFQKHKKILSTPNSWIVVQILQKEKFYENELFNILNAEHQS